MFPICSDVFMIFIISLPCDVNNQNFAFFSFLFIPKQIFQTEGLYCDLKLHLLALCCLVVLVALLKFDWEIFLGRRK